MVYLESVFIAEDTKEKVLLTYWNKVKCPLLQSERASVYHKHRKRLFQWVA